jgi:hypothetical protein
MRPRFIGLLAGVVIVSALGCGHGPPAGPNMAEQQPVSGNITFASGGPLKGGVITFYPKEIEAGRYVRFQCAASVDLKGHYTLGFNNDNKGAPAGEYVVVIEPADYGELRGANSSRIPKAYRGKSSTPLSDVVVPDGGATFDFVLK